MHTFCFFSLPVLFSVLSFFVCLFSAVPVLAFEPEWSEAESGWLLALTYPEHSPGDFGVETDSRDRELLRKFRPRVIVSPAGLLPVDFYGFYLPGTVVRDSTRGGKVIKKPPTREFLKTIEREKRYFLDYIGPALPCDDCTGYIATGYGRVFRENIIFRTGDGSPREDDITILKYSFVFPFSGLPSELGFLKEALAGLISDPSRWHELDIHGAVQVILNGQGTPVVLLLSQHNHFRSFVIGKDVTLPPDGRIPVCFAERSNEPYPCSEGGEPRFYRAVGNPKYMAYVIDGRKKPLFSGLDKVYGLKSGGREVNYKLKYLPTRDPLYVSWIPLGERKNIPFLGDFYTTGPPGIDLNTWPELKNYGDIMQFWYLRDDNSEDAALVESSFKSFMDVDFEKVLERNGKRLYRDLKEMGYVEGP